MDGSFSGIMGLPLADVRAMLATAGVSAPPAAGPSHG
jgi:predicted house-cleaning NTP pyrophosphatase (Maf/HAM1 superfamily)